MILRFRMNNFWESPFNLTDYVLTPATKSNNPFIHLTPPLFKFNVERNYSLQACRFTFLNFSPNFMSVAMTISKKSICDRQSDKCGVTRSGKSPCIDKRMSGGALNMHNSHCQIAYRRKFKIQVNTFLW